MTTSDPVDAHRALQKAARDLSHAADQGTQHQYLESIHTLNEKLRDVLKVTNMGGHLTVAKLIAELADQDPTAIVLLPGHPDYGCWDSPMWVKSAWAVEMEGHSRGGDVTLCNEGDGGAFKAVTIQ